MWFGSLFGKLFTQVHFKVLQNNMKINKLGNKIVSLISFIYLFYLCMCSICISS